MFWEIKIQNTYCFTNQSLTKVKGLWHTLSFQKGTQGKGDTTLQTHRNIERKTKLSRDYSRFLSVYLSGWVGDSKGCGSQFRNMSVVQFLGPTVDPGW